MVRAVRGAGVTVFDPAGRTAVTSRGLKIWPREAMPDTAWASCMGVASM